MKLIGVVGAFGQLGSSLMKLLGKNGVAIGRNSKTFPPLHSVIWAAGSVTSRCTENEADKEFQEIKESLLKLDFKSLTSLTLISSGGSIYGNTSSTPKFESNALEPIGPYGKLKVRLEKEFEQFCTDRGVKLQILRLANVFSSQGKGIIPTLLFQKTSNQSLNLLVNPESRKQYGHSDDYASLILQYMSDLTLDVSPSVFNLFSPNSYSLHEIFNLFAQFQEVHILDRSAQNTLPLDTVELSTLHPRLLRSYNWTTLEEFLKLQYEGVKK
jgi:nucleoside-diphosphate-sugar epimerase